MRRVHEGQYIYIDIYIHTHNIYLCIGSKINFNARVSCFAQHYFDKNILGIGQCWWGVTLLTTILLNSTWLIGKMDKIFCYDGPIFTIILRVVKLLNRISFSNTHKAEVEPSCKIYFIVCIYGIHSRCTRVDVGNLSPDARKAMVFVSIAFAYSMGFNNLFWMLLYCICCLIKLSQREWL